MADYRQVHTKMWTDEWFLELEPEAKLLWIYLFSNKRACLSGLYDIPMRVIMFEAGLPREAIERNLEMFAEAGKAFYEDGWVLIPKLMRYNANGITGPKIQANLRSDVFAAPNIPLKGRWLDEYNALIPADKIEYRMAEADIGYNAMPDMVLDTVSDRVSDAVSREQNNTEQHNTNGANAPAPTTLPEWQTGYSEASNKAGYVGLMFKTLYRSYYENHKPPNYGFIAGLVKKHDPDYMLSLVWQHSARPPSGDPLRFVSGILSKETKAGTTGTGWKIHG